MDIDSNTYKKDPLDAILDNFVRAKQQMDLKAQMEAQKDDDVVQSDHQYVQDLLLFKEIETYAKLVMEIIPEDNPVWHSASNMLTYMETVIPDYTSAVLIK